jgi:hypothetical protein
MSKRVMGWALIVVMTAFFAKPSLAADEVSLAKDMAVVIALLGLPFGQVVSVKQQGDNDHIA